MVSTVFLRTTLYILMAINDGAITRHADALSDELEDLHLHDNGQGGRLPHGDDIERVLFSIRGAFPCESDIRRPTADDIRTRNKHWQLFDLAGEKNELLVYSSFYDNRQDVGFLPVIRILGVANVKHDTFFCQIWYEDSEVPYIVHLKETATGRGAMFHNVRYGQHLYTCALPSAFPLPSYVSVTTNKCTTSSIYLPVVWPIRSPWQHEYGVCVPISHGKVNPKIIIEWIEFNRLFGVAEVNIYNGTLSSSMDKVFRYYQREGILKIRQMPPPVDVFSREGSKLGSPASLNDCMLRNMYRYRFVVLLDFDEIIVPNSKDYFNYTVMLDAIDRHGKRNSRWQSYTFRNTYFWYDFPPDKAQPTHLNTLRYRTRLPPSPGTFAPKSFIDPRHCVSVFNHYCYIRFPNSPKEWTTFVSPDFGRSHHYKKCNFDRKRCLAMSADRQKDDTMLRYKESILERTTKVLRML